MSKSLLPEEALDLAAERGVKWAQRAVAYRDSGHKCWRTHHKAAERTCFGDFIVYDIHWTESKEGPAYWSPLYCKYLEGTPSHRNLLNRISYHVLSTKRSL